MPYYYIAAAIVSLTFLGIWVIVKLSMKWHQESMNDDFDNALAIAYYREHYDRIWRQARSSFDYDRVNYRAWMETKLSIKKHHPAHKHYDRLIEFIDQMIALNKPKAMREAV